MSPLETLHEVRCLAQELVCVEGFDPERAMCEAINTMSDLEDYVIEWNAYVAELASAMIATLEVNP